MLSPFLSLFLSVDNVNVPQTISKNCLPVLGMSPPQPFQLHKNAASLQERVLGQCTEGNQDGHKLIKLNLVIGAQWLGLGLIRAHEKSWAKTRSPLV